MRFSPPSLRRWMLVLLPLLLALILVAPSARGRIGETPFQFATRYGAPKDSVRAKTSDKDSPLIQGAIHHTYEYQGWKIRAAFLHPNGPAVRIDFSKLPNGQDLPIRNSELEAIKTVNTPFGMTWTQISLSGTTNPMPASLNGSLHDRMWQRTDGAIIRLHGPMIVRVELPAARQHEDQRIREVRKAQPVVRDS